MLWTVVVSLALLLTVALALAAVVAVSGRRQFARLPDVFRCRLRLVHGLLPGVTDRWRGSPGWACWAHDVLLVRVGRLPATTHVLQVRSPLGTVSAVPTDDVKGLGPKPVMLRLRLDDGDVVELAAPAVAHEVLAGPFLVASVTGDSAESNRRPRRG